MAEVDMALVADRLTSLRKHLGERRGGKLTIPGLADELGIPEYKMIRLEKGKGSQEPLLSLLIFYRTQGYNLDWILLPDNTNVPMILPSGNELQVISETIRNIGTRLQQDYQQLTAQLKGMGYQPLEDKPFASSGASAPEVFDLS